MELGRIPPHDIEAEQAIIGSMLTDKDKDKMLQNLERQTSL